MSSYYLFIFRRAPHGEGGPKFGTKFDLNTACDQCGTGAKQVGPLLVKSSEIPKNKDIIQTLDNEYLVSSEIKEKFEQNKIKGINFIPVLNYKDNSPLNYWQLDPIYTFPSASPESSGLKKGDRQCQKCKRDGFFGIPHTKTNLVYHNIDKAQIEKADIFNTWEHFGYSNLVEDPPNPPGVFKPRRVIHFARPMLLVSEKVKNLLNDLKIQGAEFENITLD